MELYCRVGTWPGGWSDVAHNKAVVSCERWMCDFCVCDCEGRVSMVACAGGVVLCVMGFVWWCIAGGEGQWCVMLWLGAMLCVYAGTERHVLVVWCSGVMVDVRFAYSAGLVGG